jgi:hypothetical protein
MTVQTEIEVLRKREINIGKKIRDNLIRGNQKVKMIKNIFSRTVDAVIL